MERPRCGSSAPTSTRPAPWVEYLTSSSAHEDAALTATTIDVEAYSGGGIAWGGAREIEVPAGAKLKWGGQSPSAGTVRGGRSFRSTPRGPRTDSSSGRGLGACPCSVAAVVPSRAGCETTSTSERTRGAGVDPVWWTSVKRLVRPRWWSGARRLPEGSGRGRCGAGGGCRRSRSRN